MNAEAERHNELGEFLTARRRQLVRADVALPPIGGRNFVGLRREEISVLSGVSMTWYTWLEQGREIKPSRQVLNALAHALRLSVVEHTYMLSLAGYSAPQPASGPAPRRVPAHVQRLLDAVEGLPAYAIAPDWEISGWNTAYAALYPNVVSVPAADRNLLWLVFTDPYLRELMPDWEFVSRRLLAQFRADTGPRLEDRCLSRLVRRLLEASQHFRAGWESHDIEGFTPQVRLFRHPVVGDLQLEQHRLAASDEPNLLVVIYTPMLTTDAPERLRRLVGTQTFG
jgi:transcriptional regulator with XRE-family HTH domain